MKILRYATARRTWLILVYCSIVGALLIGRSSLPPERLFGDDANQYHQTAVHLSQQLFFSFDGMTPYAYREPGYSVFLASIYRIFGIGNASAIFLSQAVILLIAAVLFSSRLKTIGLQDTTSDVFLALLLLFPATFHTIFFVMRECFVLSLMLFLSTAFLEFRRVQSWKMAIAIGIMIAAIQLTYLSFFFLPLLFLLLTFVYRWKWRFLSALVALPFLLTMLWGARNYQADGQFRIIDSARTSVMWYVRGEQAENISFFEAPKCLWAEYISRDWTGLSDACSFNGLMHRRWPDSTMITDAETAARSGKAKILTHFPNYVAFSLWEVVELHLPYVNGWGAVYNSLAVLGSVVLYIGFLFALPALRRKELLFFWLVIGYTIGVFVLTDATPRYLMPIIFCYAVLSAVGYVDFFSWVRKRS